MSSILDKQIVVRLNANWQAYELITVAEAVTFLHSESHGRKPGFAIDYETVTDSEGNITLSYAHPLSWEDWIALSVRESDLYIGVGHSERCLSGRIRVPLVVICANYNQVPIKQPRLTRQGVLERDGYTCQYSGRKLPKGQLNLDHVVPRDRGGKDSWDNLVASDKDLNSRKGNKLNSEAGLKLIRKPVAPKATVKILKAADAQHPSQIPFLLK